MSMRRIVGRFARIEALESKQLLAGDVLVSVVGGNLVVQGDDLGNQIAITAGPEPGAYIVRGFDGTNVMQSPTPVESASPTSEVIVTGVTGGARIGLGNGDDRLVMADVGFRGGVFVRMGEGNDGVSIGMRPDPAPEIDALSVNGAPGAVRIGGPLSIGTGAGNDRIQIDHAAIAGELRVEAGEGEDVVRLGHPMPTNDENPTPTAAELTRPPETRDASLVAQGINIDLGTGRDEFFGDVVRAMNGFHVKGSEGEDALHLHHIWSGGPLVLDGGGGDSSDLVELDHVRAGTAVITTGAGGDHVKIVDSAFRVLGVVLGDGDDKLDLRGNAAQWAFFLGGEGTDTLHNLGGNRFGHRFVFGFETPPIV